MFPDRRGVPFTASGQAAVDAFDACVEEYLASGRDISRLLKQVVAVDPDMLMGAVLKGYLFLLTSLAEYLPRARAALADAERQAPGGSPRERAHVAALAAWSAGDLKRANRIWDGILVDHPHDILAFRLAHFLHFFVGDLVEMRDSAARIMPRWSEDVPGYGYVLGCRAFGLEETGEYAAAEPLGRRAVEINPNDIWSGHCVAHALEMMVRPRDGIAWIDGHEAVWRERGIFAHHMWWHRALYYLELGMTDAVLEAFDREFWAEPSEDNLDICNAAGMLMRLEMMGLDVGDRWESVGRVSEGRVEGRIRPFNDLHFMMALACSGRRDAARRLLDSMRDHAASHPGPEVTIAEVMRTAGIPVSEAILAWGERDYGRVVDLMQDARYAMTPLGGSWAQRDVWQRMLIEAALRAGRFPLARALLAERVSLKPASPSAWSDYARALDGAAAPAEAAAARRRAEELLAA